MELIRLEVIGICLLLVVVVVVCIRELVNAVYNIFSGIFKITAGVFKLAFLCVLTYLFVQNHNVILPYVKDVCERANDLLKLS